MMQPRVRPTMSHMGGVAGAQKRHMQGQANNVYVRDTVAKRPRVGNVKPAGSEIVYRGEVRFQTQDAVQQALQLNGTEFKGRPIGVEADERSKDGTKILISGLQAGDQWQELKDHFGMCGQVAHANIKQGVDTPGVGQVRFSSAEEAQQAMVLTGSDLGGGYHVEIKMHPSTKDGTKLQILNLPPGFEWQALKDFFAHNGLVPAFVDTSGDDGLSTAEVRYEDATQANEAIRMLNGSLLAGGRLQCELGGKEGATLFVSGVPPGIQWQEVKDYFNQAGNVAFCEVTKAGEPPKRGGGGGGGGCMGMMGGCMQGGFNMGMGKGMMHGKMGMQMGSPAVSCVGQVRFPTAEMAQQAIQLTGSMVSGRQIELRIHAASKDGTKLQIMNLPAGVEWQAVKDLFTQNGLQPLFVETSSDDSNSLGEVRFEDPRSAQVALQQLNGTMLAGGKLQVVMDATSENKVRVTGIAPGIKWQELKDHFSQCGAICFCEVTKGGPGMPNAGGCGGKFGGGGCGGGGMGMMGGKGGGMKGGQMVMQNTMMMMQAGGVPWVGQVRFTTSEEAQQAVQFNGSVIGGRPVHIHLDARSKDGTKLQVTNLPPFFEWQKLKDCFTQNGLNPCFVETTCGAGASAPMMGGGGGGGGGQGFIMGKNGVLMATGGGMGGGCNPQMFGGKGCGGGGMMQMKGGGGGGGCGGNGSNTAGEVRFATAEQAQQAAAALDGSQLQGSEIKIIYDTSSKDGTKVVVTNLRPGTTWQDLKDHCAEAGQVAFAAVNRA